MTQPKMRLKKLDIPLYELIYYFYFTIMLLVKAMGLYEGMPLYTFSLLAGGVLIVIKVAMTKHSILEYLIIGILLIVGFAAWRNSGEKGLLIYIMMIVGIKGISIPRLFRLGFFVFGFSFLLQIFLTFTGLKEDFFVIHSKLGLGHMIRWSLGYPHPNVLHISYVILIAFLLYNIEAKGKKLFTVITICFIGNLLVFMYSVSYTGLLLTTVYLIGYAYFMGRKKVTRVEKGLIGAVFPACVILSVAGPLLMNGWLFQLFDKLLNTRFTLSRYFLTNETITLFGTRFDHLSGTNYTLDCSYTMALMYYGIIPFVLICVSYLFLIRHYIKEEKKKELAIIIGFLIAGISEPFLFNTSYKNLSLLFMGNYLFELTENAGLRNSLFLSKELQLIPFGENKINLSILEMSHLKEQSALLWMKHKKIILISALLAGLILSGLYAIVSKNFLPERVYAERARCDDIGEESVYLDLDRLPDDFDGKILNYVDENTKMCEFSGTIILIEYFRGIVSSFFIAAVFFGILTFAFLISRKKRSGSEAV